MVVMNQLPAGTVLALARFELDVNQTQLTGVPRHHGDAQTRSTVVFEYFICCRVSRLLFDFHLRS